MIKLNQHAPKIGIIADDLTSAADGASPFVLRGLNALVSRGSVPQLKNPTDVISIDCASRSMNGQIAINTIRDITRGLKNSKIIYKTIDSTLRGNIRQEICAAFHASGRKRLVIAPAYPDAGRTTEDGMQLLDGMPVSQTKYAHDPMHPALTSSVIDLIDGSIGNCLILNAKTQAELDEQIIGINNPDEVLWVGSPGMAQSLAKIIAPKNNPMNVIFSVNKVLVVVGSVNEVSQNQAKLLYNLDQVACIASPSERHDDPQGTLQKICAQAIAQIANDGFEALIATGGDTMAALLDGLDIRHFRLLGELEAGFPVGIVETENCKGLIIAMKAGGLGSPSTLLTATQKLLKREV